MMVMRVFYKSEEEAVCVAFETDEEYTNVMEWRINGEICY